MRSRILLAGSLLVVAAALGAAWLLPNRAAQNEPEFVSTRDGGAVRVSAEHAALMTPPVESSSAHALDPAPRSSSTRAEGKQPLAASTTQAYVAVKVTALEDGRVLEGSRVQLHEVDLPFLGTTYVQRTKGRPGESVLTDSDGIAHFDVTAHTAYHAFAFGAWTAVGIPAGRASIEIRPLEPDEQLTVRLALPTKPDITFFGRLVAVENGSAIAEGKVELVRSQLDAEIDSIARTSQPIPRAMVRDVHERDVAPRATALPDATGLFELDSASWTFCSARVDVPGRSMVVVRVETGHDTAASALPIKLSRTSTILARVTDATRMPLAGVTVRIAYRSTHKSPQAGTSTHHPPEPKWESITDAIGNARVEDLPSDVPLALDLVSGDHVDPHPDVALVLKGGEELDLDLRFGGRASIGGTLIDHEGAALANETVWIRRADRGQRGQFEPSDKIYATARTNAQGRFVFEDLDAGDWWVGPAARLMKLPSLELSRVLAPVAELVHLRWNGSADVIVRTARGLAIRGHVIGSSGEPISDASINATLVGTSFIQRTSSNGDGSFLLGPLVEGEYDLLASIHVAVGSLGATRPNETGFAPCGPVRFKAGERNAVLSLLRGGAIRCMFDFTDASIPPSFPLVSIMNSTGKLVGPVSGGCCLGLAPGSYSAFASTSDGDCGFRTGIDVRAGETTDAGIVLHKGSRLRISREQGATRIDEYQVLSEGLRVASSRFETEQPVEHVVPAGHIVIQKHVDPDGWSEQTIDAEPGETREIVLRP